MPRRVNLTMLLGIIIVVILSFGVSAGAVQEEEEGEGLSGAVVEAASSEGEVVEEARSEFERLQWEVQAAHGARLNADGEQQQIADDVAETQNELAAAEERGEEARRELADTASQVYREGGVGDILGVLVGSETIGGFAERLDLAARLLVEKQRSIKEAGEVEDELATELEKRREQLGRFETVDAERMAVEEQILEAEANTQAHLDGLPEEVREEIESGREQQLESDKARGEEILKELAEADPSVAAQDFAEVPSATEKLNELRSVEQAAEIAVTEKAMVAEQARLVVEQPVGEQPTGEQSVGEQPVVKQPVAGEAIEKDVEAGRPDAEQAAVEAEQAATRAAEQAEAAEKARQVAERQVAVERANLQPAAKEAERQVDGQPPEVSNDTNGVVDAGDRLRVEGEFEIQRGATVTFEDADGTRGTAIDGVNANVRKGSIETEMLGPLENVAGGDGVLDTTGDLGVVDTTGIGGPGDLATGLPYDPTLGPGPIPGAAGLQYDPVIGTGTAGLQYDPVIGAAGLQYAPILGVPLPGVAGSQPGLAVNNGDLNSLSSGQPGLQPAAGAPKAAGPASGNAIVAEAMSWLGTPYSFGGTSRGGISCSGLVMMAYQKLGISLPNSPGGQLGAVGELNPGPAPAGAIVFFSEDGSGTPTHVGIANGDGTMTDSNIVKGQVGITPIDIVTGYMGWGVP